MNWLAHIFLAGDDPEDQIGGVLADVLSVPASAGLSAGIRRGIMLHRLLDLHGDAHPAFLDSCRRLAQADVGLRSLACGVAVDVLYDHLLAVQWDEWCTGTRLTEFAARFYQQAISRAESLPPTAAGVLRLMAAEDWLGSYRQVAGIRSTLSRIRARLSPRAAEQSPLPAAVDVYLSDAPSFAANFAVFLPAMQARARNFFEQEKATFGVAGRGQGT